jgi:hypothetical protein
LLNVNENILERLNFNFVNINRLWKRDVNNPKHQNRTDFDEMSTGVHNYLWKKLALNQVFYVNEKTLHNPQLPQIWPIVFKWKNHDF